MTRNSKAGDLYKQKKALKKQLDTLEQDKIQPLIVDLYKILSGIRYINVGMKQSNHLARYG